MSRLRDGTLCLSRVDRLPLNAQETLMSVLGGAQEAVPGSAPRIMATTTGPLTDAARAGRFNPELLSRLSAITLETPPLRRRRRDILPLVSHFLAQRGDGRKLSLDRAVASAFEHYAWPGNVSEVKDVLGNALASLSGDSVELKDLPESICSSGAVQSPGEEKLVDDGLRGQSLRAYLERKKADLTSPRR